MRVVVSIVPDAAIPGLKAENLKEKVEGKLRNLGIATTDDSPSVLEVEIIMNFKRAEDPCYPATIRAGYMRQAATPWTACRSANTSPPHFSEIEEAIDKCVGEFLTYLLNSGMGG